MARPHPLLRTVAAVLPTVLASILLADAGLLLVRVLVPAQVLRTTNDIAGNYLQTLGTIFAVLLAFVVFVVWTQFNEARTFVEREANELHDLARTATGLPAPLGDGVRRGVLRYVEIVLGPEWEAMGRRDPSGFGDGWAALEELWDVLRRAEPASPREEALYGELLARFNDLSDARAIRLSSACTKIPAVLRVLLYSGSFVTVASMSLFAVDRFALHAVMTGALAGCVSHVLHVISDLDDCFSGDWQVGRLSFERVRAYASSEGRGGGAREGLTARA